MIKNIIFDMGGVLIDFDAEKFLDYYHPSLQDRLILKRNIFNSLEWAMMDRGTLDEEKMFEIVKQRIPTRLHELAYNLLFNWDKICEPIIGMPEYVKQLKEAGYKIYLLSNASVRCMDDYWPKVKGSEYFDGQVVSADIGYIKPEKEIYEYLLNKYKLKKEECIFIDDRIGNVEGAHHVGIKSIVFQKDIELFKQELEQMLVTN
ncbi:MAG: HAD family phosphatase [Erysipelotrichaceae bacterium]|nr:HAD family phosphatase [Erysipelotrichaceae bacterium]